MKLWRSLTSNLNDTEKHAAAIEYEKNGLKAHLQQSHRGQDKVGESNFRVQGAIDRFSAGLKKDLEYIERHADEDGRDMESELGNWMAERLVEAHKRPILNHLKLRLTSNHLT